VAIVPKANAPKPGAMRELEGLTLHPVDRIEEALEVVRSLQ
jgi:DNA repair protein RadA/Sms